LVDQVCKHPCNQCAADDSEREHQYDIPHSHFGEITVKPVDRPCDACRSDTCVDCCHHLRALIFECCEDDFTRKPLKQCVNDQKYVELQCHNRFTRTCRKLREQGDTRPPQNQIRDDSRDEPHAVRQFIQMQAARLEHRMDYAPQRVEHREYTTEDDRDHYIPQ